MPRVVVRALASYFVLELFSLSESRSLSVGRSDCLDMYTHSDRDLMMPTFRGHFGSKQELVILMSACVSHFTWSALTL